MIDSFMQFFNAYFAGYAPYDIFGIGLAFSLAMEIPIVSIWVIGKIIDLILYILDRFKKKGE